MIFKNYIYTRLHLLTTGGWDYILRLINRHHMTLRHLLHVNMLLLLLLLLLHMSWLMLRHHNLSVRLRRAHDL